MGSGDGRVGQHHHLLTAAAEINGNVFQGRAGEAQARRFPMIGAAHAIELSFGGLLELLHAIHKNIITLFCFDLLKRRTSFVSFRQACMTSPGRFREYLGQG